MQSTFNTNKLRTEQMPAVIPSPCGQLREVIFKDTQFDI